MILGGLVGSSGWWWSPTYPRATLCNEGLAAGSNGIAPRESRYSWGQFHACSKKRIMECQKRAMGLLGVLL